MSYHAENANMDRSAMRLATTLNIFALIVLLLSGAGIGLTIWNAQQAERHLNRMLLANESYVRHLTLSKGIYRLLNRVADDELGRTLNSDYPTEALITRVENDLRAIRAVIGAEIELVGEEEIEELELLAEIEQRSANLIEIIRAPVETAAGSKWPAATRALNDGDGSIRELIDEALAEEMEEVAEAKEAAERQFAFARSAAIILGMIALGVTLIALIAVRRQVSRPLESLLQTIQRFGAGDYSARASARGAGEIALFSSVVNDMAEKVEASAQKDATRRSELEAAVHSRTRQLEGVLSEMEAATENRKRLLADVSHELRTPLTIIRGEADVALRGEDKPTEAYREALTRTRDAAAHTARLVDDLLFVARSEAGAARLDVSETDLISVANGLARLSDRPVSVATTLASAKIEADAQRLRQCILILVENASRYGGETIVVRIDKAVGGYRIAVEDDGPGMAPEERERAFQRYFRGSNAASRYSDGVGLGLPVAKSIVDAHGGAIAIDDREGGGLVVAFTLPARAKRVAA